MSNHEKNEEVPESTSETIKLRIDLDGLVSNAVGDLEVYETACEKARESGDVDELPDPGGWVFGEHRVQNAATHRWALEQLVGHLRMVRDGLRAGNDGPLRQFFELYVIDGTHGLERAGGGEG